jgi:hypothetical protein
MAKIIQISVNLLFSIFLMNYLLSIEFYKLSILAVGTRNNLSIDY